MKRRLIKPVSDKRKARMAEVREFRSNLVAEVGRCEVCGHDPTRVKPGQIAWSIACHEVANGPDRDKALDCRFAILVCCWLCNSEDLTDKVKWPQARQLAVLKRSRPYDYDLAAFNELVGYGKDRITEAEVAQYEEEINGQV